MARNIYVVSYDISNPKRLRTVHKTMRGFGDALQLSVFRCELSERERELLLSRLHEIIHHHEDQVLLVDLGPRRGSSKRRIRLLGRPSPPLTNDPLVF